MALRRKGRKEDDQTPAGRAHRKQSRPSSPSLVVGIGASAGGLEAFSELLRAVPPSSGIAFVFVQHQERKHASMLREILGRTTSLPVTTVDGDTVIERDHVYVAPAGSQVVVSGGCLQLRENGDTSSMPIDQFLSSLAEDQGPRAAAVVLSGTASDGSLGIQAIKSEGGITMAQDESAKFEGMPQSAVSTGSVDFVLRPADIARQLARLARRRPAEEPGEGKRLPKAELAKLFGVLHNAHGVDFTHYKPTTIERRIRRRLALHRIGSVADYLELLSRNPQEIEELYRDLLIRVTGFFRDPEVFQALQRSVLPEMLNHRPETEPLRVWVPGCATGEEVYSMAIVLLEQAEAAGWRGSIQIFGTDVNEAALSFARVGAYSANTVADVSAERLHRFFARSNGGYRVSTAVRDCCIFARQNLTTDPPFSRIDLISCRNVMIYLGALLQRRVLSIFHYALRPDGYLVLGSSETIGNFGDLFAVVDRKHRLYRKQSAATRLAGVFRAALPGGGARPERNRMEEEATSAPNVFREADRVALARFAPAGVVINESAEIVQFRGRTSPFLEPAPGTASFHLLKMAREGLLPDLHAAIHAARKNDGPVRREGIRVRSDGGTITVNIEIIPFVTPTKERYQVVLFEEANQQSGGKKARPSRAKETEPDSRAATRLKRELEATREYLQSIIEEQEAMNEELRSANEEIQSSNEELQSTNEELETAKEELQSSNEELTTLNEELEIRNAELNEVNNDLINLLASIDVPIVMLDSDLRIRRFTPGAQRILNLIPTDVGRPLNDLKTTLLVEDLETFIGGVINDLDVREREVMDRFGGHYLLRVRPYKTIDQKIEGAVLVLLRSSPSS